MLKLFGIPILSLFVLAALPIAYAYSEVTIVPAAGSGAPGCETEPDGCYLPSTATVDVGGVVIMTNTDSAAHTYTSGTPDGGPDGVFDTSLLMVNNSFEWNPMTVGEQPYFCMVHPWMVGSILVTPFIGDNFSNDDEFFARVPTNLVELTVHSDKSSYFFGDSIKITGTTNPNTSLENKISLSEVRVVDAFGNALSGISTDQQIQLTADLTNNQKTEQPFAYIIQILDDHDTVVSISWITGSLSSEQSFGSALSWIPEESGKFHGKIFIWDSIDTAASLGVIATFDLDVGTGTKPLTNLTIKDYDVIPLSLMFVSPRKNMVLLDEMQPINNRFGGTYVAQGSMWDEYGEYQIKAVYGDQITTSSFSLKEVSQNFIPEDPVDDPVRDPVDDPVRDPVDDPVRDPVDDPVRDPVDDPVRDPVDDPVRDPVDDPVRDPVDDINPLILITVGGSIAVGIGIAVAKGVFTGGSSSSSTSAKPTSQKPSTIDIKINYEVGFEK